MGQIRDWHAIEVFLREVFFVDQFESDEIHKWSRAHQRFSSCSCLSSTLSQLAVIPKLNSSIKRISLVDADAIAIAIAAAAWSRFIERFRSTAEITREHNVVDVVRVYLCLEN